MTTVVLRVDPQRPDPATLEQAVQVLRRGGLVAFPTETVYGLGANALDEDAVGRIFAAKGRPAGNPLIIHVADAVEARDLVTSWPTEADHLAQRFWPGPLTLVLPRQPHLPAALTGGPTVALRAPAHPVALALLRAVRLPLAAPSANPSGRLSPTRAEHVIAGLDGRIDMVLDGGPCPGGLESTVLDLTTVPARILRPGLVSRRDLETVLGPVEMQTYAPADEPLRSPGLLARHYAPRTPLELVGQTHASQRVQQLMQAGLRVAWLTFQASQRASDPGVESPLVERMPADPRAYAACLYEVLHRLDQAAVDRIVVEEPPAGDEWLACHDRLTRAGKT